MSIVTPAAGQQPQQLSVGQQVTGRLAAADPRLVDGTPFHVYRIEARQDQRFVIIMRSDDVDAFVEVLRPTGTITQWLDSDDDSDGGTDARLVWQAPAAGTFLIIARPLSGESYGQYTLLLEEAAQPRLPTATVIRPGESRVGTLDRQSAGTLYDGNAEILYDLLTFTARAGQRFVIDMMSDDFDAYLAVGDLSGGTVNVIHTDDDGGDGTNARLRVTIPRDGTWAIQARAFDGAASGRYTIRLTQADAVQVRDIALNTPVTADFDHEPVDWRFRVQAPTRVVITMTSDDFDTYLELGRMDGSRFVEIASNDDDETTGTTNSRIDFVLPSAGDYVIRARAFADSGSGRYALTVTSN